MTVAIVFTGTTYGWDDVEVHFDHSDAFKTAEGWTGDKNPKTHEGKFGSVMEMFMEPPPGTPFEPEKWAQIVFVEIEKFAEMFEKDE